MKLDEARKLAGELREQLKPYCIRIEIAGSIRRQRSNVKDIELVAIRKSQDLRLLKWTLEKYPRIKGRADGKYMQFKYGGINVDLFFADIDNWGNIFAIRTGSAEFSHKVLARGWVKAGYKSKDGYLRDRTGQKIPLLTEKQLFDLIGRGWIRPELRETES